MSKHKIIFFSIAGGILLVIILIFSYFSNIANKNKPVGPDSLSVWVVGDETAGFSDIITGFKTRNPQFTNTDIVFTKFSNYEDYEKTLLAVMADGNSPDIFVINNNSINNEGNGLLESKIIGLSKNVVDLDYFQKNFNKVFDELIIQNEEENSSGDKIKVDYLKGIPLGYQTLGVFYNFKEVRNIPGTWSELDEEIIKNQKEDYATIALGLGEKYIHNSADIFSLLMIQNGMDSYSKFKDGNAGDILKGYQSYYSDTNNGLSGIQKEMDELGLTTVDMFVRGKIGMLVGYPSLLKEIILSVKRTSGNSSLSPRYLRTSSIFQVNSGDKEENTKLNLINYNFLALSKFSQKQEVAMSFLSYLSTKEAQEKYLKSFSYYLPALKSLEDSRLEQSLDNEYDRTKYSNFLSNDVELKSFDKGLASEYDDYIGYDILSTIQKEEKAISLASDYIECNINHIIKGIDFEKKCK